MNRKGIYAHQLCTRLGSFGLGPLDLHAAPGEHQLIVGPSGAGKSLLLRVLAGFHPLSSGTLHHDERSLQDVAPAQRGYAWVGQRATLFPHLTVRDNIAFGLWCKRVPDRDIEPRVSELAARFNVSDVLARKPHQLSVGQQQRVALARALAPGLQTLLLDEPFSALDRGARLEMYALLDALCAQMRLCIVHVTHDVDLLVSSEHHAVALVAGRIVHRGTIRSMLEHPQDERLRAALGSVQAPRIAGTAIA